MGRTPLALMMLAAAALMVTGCASNPFAGQLPPDLNRAATPKEAADHPDRVTGQPVMWGGSIVSIHNLKDTTEIAVLAYPLDGSGMPEVEKQADGRFILRHSGFLDPVVYGPGRLVTVLGPVTGVIHGKVAEAPYTFPVVKAQKLHLWKPVRPANSHFMFGLDLGFGL